VDVPDDDLCLLPATRLAGMLRAREVSARELLAAHLARVDRLNPTVNALVTLDVEGASAAAAAEALIAEPMVLLDHVVGAGKSGSMLMGAMEL